MNNIRKIISVAPFIMVVVMAVVYFTELRNLSFEQLVEYTPESTVAAAAVILVMYALKSLSFFFPMALIAAAAGAVLPLWLAIPVNLAGIVVMSSVPFFIGKYAEREVTDKLAAKNKKIEVIKNFGTDNQTASSFFARIISCLPYDIVSLVFGSMNYSYRKYLLGTFLGTAPSFILTTIMGASITDPFSPQFLICLGTNVVLAVSAFIVFRFRKRS